MQLCIRDLLGSIHRISSLRILAEDHPRCMFFLLLDEQSLYCRYHQIRQTIQSDDVSTATSYEVIFIFLP